jgi:hypothetical protein
MNGASTKWIIRLLLVVVMVFLLVQFAGSLRHKRRIIIESTSSRVRWELQAIYSALSAFGEEKPDHFRSSVTNRTFVLTGSMAAELEGYLRQMAIVPVERYANVSTIGIVDRWGNPVHGLVARVDGCTNTAAIRGDCFQIELYSVGENGKDEQGAGDDVKDASREVFVRRK